MSRFTPRSRAAWRAWLAKNHDASDGVSLVFYKRGTGKENLSYDDAVEEALCFGWIDSVKRSIDEERYQFRFTPRKKNSKWSPSNKKRVERLVAAGEMTPTGQRAIDAAKRSGAWDEPDRPAIDLSMPADLAARLRRNKAARTFFEGLAPSYRRQFIGWIVTAKRDETRRRRLDETLELLARGEKLGMR
ncbi:MAG TPA: YdeI/OmpD-associated family protein [Acidobacteriota bacterium]